MINIYIFIEGACLTLVALIIPGLQMLAGVTINNMRIIVAVNLMRVL